MEEVEIKLSKDEALVIFDLLARFSSEDKLVIQDQSEERALWNLKCIFEEKLTEPFQFDWDAILNAAQNRLRDKL